MLVDQGLKLTGQVGKSFRQRVAGLGPQLAIGEMGQTVAFGADQAPTGRSEPRIETEDEAQASFSNSSSGTLKLPETVLTS